MSYLPDTTLIQCYPKYYDEQVQAKDTYLRTLSEHPIPQLILVQVVPETKGGFTHHYFNIKWVKDDAEE